MSCSGLAWRPMAWVVVLAGGLHGFSAAGQDGAGSGGGNAPTARTYLSDTDRVYRSLERLQQAEIKTTKESFPDVREVPLWPLDEKSLKARGASDELLASIRAQFLEELGKPLPTRHESPRIYFQIRLIKDTLDQVALSLYGNPAVQFRVGTLLTLGEKAELLSLENEPVVVIDRFLFNFIHEMARLSLESLSARSYEEVDPVARRLLDLLDVFNRKAYLPRSNAATLPPDQLVQLERMTETMETFVLAHEYVHLLKKHEPINMASLAVATQDVRTVQHSWQQELWADIEGYRMTLKTIARNGAARGDEPGLERMLWLAPSLYLESMLILDDARYVCEKRQLQAEPDAALRAAVARMAIAALRGVPVADDPAFSNLKGHPPWWARYVFVDTAAALHASTGMMGDPVPSIADTDNSGAPPERRAAEYARRGPLLVERLKRLWFHARPAYLDHCREQAAQGIRNKQ